MDVKQWNTLREAFNALVEMSPVDQKRALGELYDNNPTIAAEVEELLEEDAYGKGLPEMNIEQLLADASRCDDSESTTQSQIGPYRVIRLLGEGGMGVVYLAERTDIGGYVAIKLLRDAWLSPVRRERFAVEQQMLGLLNHPSIARIYDAGTTQEGTPWFVMEFADGVTITEYLRIHAQTAREKVKLFRVVCETVRYAHSHAIIHRDLKPSNILVTRDGRIKLLDFGIAKQMDLVNRGNNATTAGLRLFTPAYAAPELQSENDVGVFTDIYSLGVILYELLAGAPPPDGGLRRRELQRPSTSAIRDGSSVELALGKDAWRDIDAICMKALDPEAESRYGSTDALIYDLDAFLEDRPLIARKRAFLYTAGKFARRNRVALLSVTLGLLLIVSATVLFTIRLARARDAAARARDAAVLAAAHSERIQRFTETLFTGGASYGSPPPGIKVTEMLDRGRSEALQMTGDPQLQTAMLRILGTAYLNLGHYGDAEPLLRRAQQESCTSIGSLECADIEVALGQVISKHGSMLESETLLKDALQIKQKMLPVKDLSIADTMLDLGWVTGLEGDFVGAKDLFTKALAIASADGRPSRQLAEAMDAYGQYAYSYNDPRVMQYEEQSAQMTKQLFGADSYDYAESEASLGNTATNLGKYDQAEQYYRRALTAVQAWSGAEEGIVVRYLNKLGFILSLEGKFSESEALFLHSLAILSRDETPPSLELCNANFYLGYIKQQQGNLRAAEDYFNSVVAVAHQHHAVAEVDLELSELGLATIYAKRGAFRRSETVIRQVLATTRQEASYTGVAAHALLGHALLREGRVREAEPELQKAYQWFSHDPTIRPQTVQTYQDLSETESRLHRPQEAARIRMELRNHPK
jgi:tetratricopeptide (TPR) repeat protein/tRNA A-37 threonylcarbamoyl transferase component Bud32